MSRGIRENSVEFRLGAHNFTTVKLQLLYLGQVAKITWHEANSASSRGRFALPSRVGLRNLSIESRKDRFKESILHETQHSLPSIGLRRFNVSRDRGLGRYFFSRPILQQAGDPADKALVEFSKHAFLTILALIIDVHISEKRLYVTLYLPLSNLDFRIEGKNSASDVEIAVGAEEVVHRTHIGIFGAQRDIKIGTFSFRAKGKIDLRWPVAHKLPFRLSPRDAVFKVFAQIFDVYCHIRKKHPVRWFCRPIDEGELAIARCEFIHFHLQGWLIAIFSRGLPYLFGDLLGRRGRCLVVIVRVKAIES